MRTLLGVLPWVNSVSQKPKSPSCGPGKLPEMQSSTFVSVCSWCRSMQKWEQKLFHVTRAWWCALGSRLTARQVWGLGSVPQVLAMPLPKFVQCSWGRAVGANCLGYTSFIPLSLEVLDCLRIWHQHTNKWEVTSTLHGRVGCLASIVFWTAPGEGHNSALVVVTCPCFHTLLWLGNLKLLRCFLVRTEEVL